MSRQSITPGKAPIVWSTVEEAFTKINANFTELYASIGDTGSILFDELESDLVPFGNDVYNLGAPNKRWASLYLSNTLVIGGAAITNEGLTINLPSGTRVGGDLIIDPDKAFFKEFSVNSSTSVVADQFNDVLDFNAGTGIQLTVTSTNDQINITNTGVTSLIAGTAMTVSSSTGAITVNNAGVTAITAGLGMSRNNATGTVTIVNEGIVDVDAGNGISVGARDAATGRVIVTNTAPAGNAYRIFATAGEPSLTARSTADTITLIEGAGINITNTIASGAFTNRITLDNTGVLSLTAGNGVTLSGSTGNITISVGSGDLRGSLFADDSTMLVDGTSGRIVGPVFANVTGDVTGNVTGTLTGNSSGTHTGAVVGNVTGNVNGILDGDMTGSVFADNSTMLIDGTGGRIVGPVDSVTVAASSYIQTAVYVDLTAIAAALPTPNKGMIVFDDGTNQFRGYDGASWVALN